ncbi:hypothetical protein BDV97DRAFT_40551 [Delphinella strobiligena]|nr:hypothetical protein BDV97DRAFT_40551 [Delphinella strobiligena]
MTGPPGVSKAKCRGTHSMPFSPLSAVKLLDAAITVKVGDVLTEFSVHQGLVCHFSAFFRSAMRSHCKEARARTVELPKVEVPTFASFSA